MRSTGLEGSLSLMNAQTLRGSRAKARERLRVTGEIGAAYAFFRFSVGNFAALRSASLMRLCQPRPVPR